MLKDAGFTHLKKKAKQRTESIPPPLGQAESRWQCQLEWGRKKAIIIKISKLPWDIPDYQVTRTWYTGEQLEGAGGGQRFSAGLS